MSIKVVHTPVKPHTCGLPDIMWSLPDDMPVGTVVVCEECGRHFQIADGDYFYWTSWQPVRWKRALERFWPWAAFFTLGVFLFLAITW